MPSLRQRVTTTLDRARRRWPVLDHVVRMQEHYGKVNGGAQAGAVTYFAFLSFFPILALAFFVVGYVALVYPSARDNLSQALEQVLPGIVGPHKGEIHLSSLEHAAGTVGLVGLVGLLYSGLGWLSGMRTALEVVFDLPRSQYPNFFVGKLRDLMALAVIGVTLVVSVAITGVVAGFSTRLLDVINAGHGLAWLVHVLGVLVGLAANMLLFTAMFRLLAHPHTPRRSLWQGALLGAVAFEALKLASSYLLAATKHQPAFQAFGIALILLVWINYFSRVVLYAAAWAQTASQAPSAASAAGGDVVPTTPPSPQSPPVLRASGMDPRVAFAAGAAAMLGLLAALRRRRR
jgi:membrane protein